VLEIGRTIRFCLNADGSLNSDDPVDNSHAAWPPMRGLGRYYEIDVICRGNVDPVTGYFLNIKLIDDAVRRDGLPVVAAGASGQVPMGHLLQQLFEAVNGALDGCVDRLVLRLTPTYAVQITGANMSEVLISQRYQFAAAHRLHVASLDATENQRVFGKCNNPNGHGHNYHLEVTVAAPVDSGGDIDSVSTLDRVVDQSVILPLDHKHLDLDVPEFQNLNSSVENIAMVVHQMLKSPLNEVKLDLREVRVWETAKTVCTYRSDDGT
jgi:6-pyruvoyltetrahydropterin/6-carboxytetrahydropterin synthase